MTQHQPNDEGDKEWRQLLVSIATAGGHPEETCWAIHHYLKAYYQELGSVLSRTLLSAYMKLYVRQPSSLNSSMLRLAVDISASFDDFRLTRFLEAWGYDVCLRDIDRKPAADEGGAEVASLKAQVDDALKTYLERHPDDHFRARNSITLMYADSKVERTIGERHVCLVRLVAADGTTTVADIDALGVEAHRAVGQLFEVHTRMTSEGREQTERYVVAKDSVADVFPTTVGYVDGIDLTHDHVHIYDAQSHHYVASRASVAVSAPSCGALHVGDFVWFCPILARGDAFKRAAVVARLSHDDGLAAFGVYEAIITYIDRERGFLRYAVSQAVRPTPEGTITAEGSAPLPKVESGAGENCRVGQRVRLLLYLRRCKDGVKRNHVAEIIP